jgi:regulator of cell morphogenesis and NO signaling
VEAGAGAGVVWTTRPVAELVDHIVSVFHAVEQRELADLQEALRAAAGRQPGSAALDDLADAIARLRVDLCEHMAKEETVLFPWLRSGRGDLARTPIQVMMMEHDATLRLLNHVRALRQTWVATAPAAAEIVERLTALDRNIREHMHLENNVLFPRALRGEE